MDRRMSLNNFFSLFSYYWGFFSRLSAQPDMYMCMLFMIFLIYRKQRIKFPSSPIRLSTNHISITIRNSNITYVDKQRMSKLLFLSHVYMYIYMFVCIFSQAAYPYLLLWFVRSSLFFLFIRWYSIQISHPWWFFSHFISFLCYLIPVRSWLAHYTHMCLNCVQPLFFA